MCECTSIAPCAKQFIAIKAANIIKLILIFLFNTNYHELNTNYQK